jgi:RecA-family ATPase
MTPGERDAYLTGLLVPASGAGSNAISTNAAGRSVELQLLDAFRPAQQAHGIADFTHATTNAKGKVLPRYETIRRAPNEEDVRAHLSGDTGLLFIPVNGEGRCQFGVIDIDDYTLDFAKFLREVTQRGYQCVPARTKSGGLHLEFFFRAPQIAEDVRVWLKNAAAELGYARAEVFPKQNVIDLDDGRAGNGINLPYFGAAQNKALGEDGQELTVDEYLARIETVRMAAIPDVVVAAAEVVPMPTVPDPRAIGTEVGERAAAAAEVLRPFWKEGSRNPMSYAVQGYLCRLNEPDLADAIVADLERMGGGTNLVRSARAIKELDKGAHVPGLPTLTEHITNSMRDAAKAKAVIAEFKKACGLGLPDEERKKPYIQLMTQPEDWFTSRAPPLEFLVEGLLPRGAVAMNIAEPATGKTVLMTKLGFHVAMGLDFLGRKTQQGTVAYVALEDRLPMLRRRFEFTRDRIIKALQDAKVSLAEIDRRIGALKKNFHFVAGAGVEMHLVSMLTGVVMQMPAITGLIEALPRPLELLMLDPYARLHGCEENSTAVGTAMVSACERIAREAECAVMISHHVSKNTAANRQEDQFSARGSSAVPAAARVMWRMLTADENDTKGFKNLEPGVVARGDLVKLTVVKANDFKKPERAIWLRRQALDFEVFNPEIGGSEEALKKQLAELYEWWLREERRAFYTSTVVKMRELIFAGKVAKAGATLVVDYGEDKGILVKGDKPPRCTEPGLVFKDDYDPNSM